MELLQTSHINCPNCGELIEIIIDCSVLQQNYIEDCTVCCRPINLNILVNETTSITVMGENE